MPPHSAITSCFLSSCRHCGFSLSPSRCSYCVIKRHFSAHSEHLYGGVSLTSKPSGLVSHVGPRRKSLALPLTSLCFFLPPLSSETSDLWEVRVILPEPGSLRAGQQTDSHLHRVWNPSAYSRVALAPLSPQSLQRKVGTVNFLCSFQRLTGFFNGHNWKSPNMPWIWGRGYPCIRVGRHTTASGWRHPSLGSRDCSLLKCTGTWDRANILGPVTCLG